MPRDHGRVLCRIWQDPVFRARTPEAQRLYVVILTQQNVNNAGVVPLMMSKWAKASEHTTINDVATALSELVDHRFVLVDGDTEEAFIRSFMRNDGVVKQPNVLKNALRMAKTVESPTLRFEMAQELRRLNRRDANTVADEIDPPGGVSDDLSNPPETLSEPIGNPSVGVEPLANPSSNPAGRGRGSSYLTEGNNSLSKDNNRSSAPQTTAYSKEFDEFWTAYPRKSAKRKAFAAWKRAVRRTDGNATLVAGATRYREDPNREDGFTKQGEAWLNGDCWLDEPLPPRRQSRPSATKPDPTERGRSVADIAQKLKAQQGATP
jgi:hypothetical protein